jgi:hypothetical protein
MLRLKERFAGDYTLDADATDKDGRPVTVTDPAVSITRENGKEVFSGTPDAELAVRVPFGDLPPGVFLATFTGAVHGRPQEWRVWFEVVAELPPTDPTYGHYLSFGNTLPEAVFDEHIRDAIALVDRAVWPNVVTDVTREAYRRAVCAVVDAISAGPALVSLGSGRTSETYAPGDVRTTDRVVREHLAGTGLLYLGL